MRLWIWSLSSSLLPTSTCRLSGDHMTSLMSLLRYNHVSVEFEFQNSHLPLTLFMIMTRYLTSQNWMHRFTIHGALTRCLVCPGHHQVLSIEPQSGKIATWPRVPQGPGFLMSGMWPIIATILTSEACCMNWVRYYKWNITWPINPKVIMSVLYWRAEGNVLYVFPHFVTPFFPYPLHSWEGLKLFRQVKWERNQF